VSADEIKKALKLKAAFSNISTRCSDSQNNASISHMLEFDDIQHILLTRTPALTDDMSFCRSQRYRWTAWLNEILKTVQSTADVLDSVDEDKRWVTWRSLEWPQALGVDETSLATFPEEFKQGMAARAEILGDTGANHPDNW